MARGLFQDNRQEMSKTGTKHCKDAVRLGGTLTTFREGGEKEPGPTHRARLLSSRANMNTESRAGRRGRGIITGSSPFCPAALGSLPYLPQGPVQRLVLQPSYRLSRKKRTSQNPIRGSAGVSLGRPCSASHSRLQGMLGSVVLPRSACLACRKSWPSTDGRTGVGEAQLQPLPTGQLSVGTHASFTPAQSGWLRRLSAVLTPSAPVLTQNPPWSAGCQSVGKLLPHRHGDLSAARCCASPST